MEKTEGLEARVLELEAEVGSLEEELGKLNVCGELVFPLPVLHVSASTFPDQNQDITIREMESRLLSMEKDIDEQVSQRVKGREVWGCVAGLPSVHVPQRGCVRICVAGAAQPT